MKFWVWVSQQYWNPTTLIQSYSVQHWFICTSFNEYEYNVDIKLITIEICLIHTPTHSDSQSYYKWFEWFKSFVKIYSLSCCCIYKERRKTHKQKRKRQQAEKTHNLLVSIVVFVRESYLFCDSCICCVKENRNKLIHT